MRKISSAFIDDLKKENGKLNSFYKLRKTHPLLIWEIRDDYISIYYRGGRLFEIWKKNYGYRVNWDIKYTKIGKGNIDEVLKKEISNNAQIREASDCKFWIDKLDNLISLMDKKWIQNPKKEKFIQQNFVLEPPVKNMVISDFEYQKILDNNAARFDLMGVREINKKNTLSFIELKQGYRSVSSTNNASGLYKHYKDILQVVSNKKILKDEVDQTKQIFQIKNELFKQTLQSEKISNESIEVLFVLANYKTGKNFSKNLENEINKIKSHPKIEITVDIRFQFLDVNEKDFSITRFTDIIDINNCITEAEEFYR